MREEQRDIEPWNKVEEENSRDETVLGRDQIKDERADAGEGLAQAQPMLAEQFVLQEIILRSVAAERLQRHARGPATRNKCCSGARSVRRRRRMEGDHDPDAEPEEDRDEDDLAEQEKAIETFRALRDHDYLDDAG